MIFQVSQDLDNSNDEEYYTLLKRKRFDVKDGRAVLFVVRMGISKARNGNIIQAWVRRKREECKEDTSMAVIAQTPQIGKK